jgi:hypothetical protein
MVASNYWAQVLKQLNNKKDFETWGIFRSNKKPFSAKTVNNNILIESPSLASPRVIWYTEFECVASLYQDYKKKKSGIRPKMRNKCGINSSYIITLIHELCD